MVKVYYDGDADLKKLRKKIAIIGYGSQGHAQAQNLRDSGLKVIVAELRAPTNYKLAIEHGFKPITGARSSSKSRYHPDSFAGSYQAQIYKNEIKANLKRGKTLFFSHGFNIHFGQIRSARKC